MKRGKEKADKDKDPHAPRKPPSAGRRQRGSHEKPNWPQRLLGLGFLFVIGGPAVVTVLSYFGGTGIAHLDVHDTAKLKSVLFSGEPWLVYCVNNDTQSQRLPKVLEDSAGPLRSNLGLAVGVLQCWDKTESGRSVAQRFKLSASPPLSFLVANGNKPRVVSLVGAKQPEDLEKKLKPALALETPRIDTLKKWSTLCTSRRACVVVGHKNTAQRDTALNLVRPNLERYRALKVVTLDTSFWQLKLDKGILATRPSIREGADVLCLSRTEGGGKNRSAAYSGKFMGALTSSGTSALMGDCDRQSGLVRMEATPKIKARPSKPKKVKASPLPVPRPSPSPPPGKPRRTNVDRVGSRAQMEQEDEALFEAVEEEPGAGDDAPAEETGEESPDDEEEDGGGEHEDAHDDEEVEL